MEQYAKCPACGGKQRHKVLRVKEGGIAICKCEKCGCLHHITIKGKDVELMLILSSEGKAIKEYKKFDSEEKLERMGVVELNGKKYEIRSIEDANGERRDKTNAGNARTLWIAPYEKQLSVSVHQKGGQTKAFKITKMKDEFIRVGDRIKDVTITKIQTEKGNPEKEQVKDILALQGRL
jgi:uncharacterized Zn finger protein